jgi:predicted dehydrogenase
MQTVKVGLVGAGFAGSIHAEAYKHVRSAHVEIIGIAAKELEEANSFKTKHGIEYGFDSAEKLLKTLGKDIDIIDLPVPSYLHAPLTILAAEEGKHIICEKPMTGYFGQDFNGLAGNASRDLMLQQTLKSAGEMERAVRKNSVKFCYAENWVYAPPIAKARKLLAASNAKILEMRGGEAHSGSHSNYAYQWKFTGGGSLIRQGAHPIGAAIQLKHWEGLRAKDKRIHPESVVCEVGHLRDVAAKSTQGQKRNYFLGTPQDVEDWAGCIINFEDGTKAIINAGDNVLGGIQNVMSIYADTCRVHCNINPNDVVQAYTPDKVLFDREYIVEKTETKEGWSFPQPDEEMMTGYYDEMEDFVQCVLQAERQPTSGIEVAMDCIKVIYAGYLAAEKGQRISLK